ncbi:MAG TPA: flavodoxin family protein [Eggerthellaceae bacterium]|nr:flavodoxin family protein [Eggerthellaceae bacterium]
MKTLVINGSPHKAGTTDKALAIVEAALAEEGLESERIWIGNRPVRGCIACEKCAETARCAFSDDVANEIIENLLEADGLVVGTPVYFAGANGALLALLDRVFYAASAHDRRLFAGKPAAGVATLYRAGSTSALDEIGRYFAFSGMPIVSSLYWNLMFDDGNDKFGEDMLGQLGRNMADLIKAMAR